MDRKTEGPNSGIVISGGNVSIGQAVAGQRARASYQAAAPGADAALMQLRERLDELERGLAAGTRPVDAGTREALADARREVERAEPDTGALSKAMAVVAQGAQSTTAVVGTLSAIASLIGLLA
jgi:hypothetical protein